MTLWEWMRSGGWTPCLQSRACGRTAEPSSLFTLPALILSQLMDSPLASENTLHVAICSSTPFSPRLSWKLPSNEVKLKTISPLKESSWLVKPPGSVALKVLWSDGEKEWREKTSNLKSLHDYYLTENETIHALKQHFTWKQLGNKNPFSSWSISVDIDLEIMIIYISLREIKQINLAFPFSAKHWWYISTESCII